VNTAISVDGSNTRGDLIINGPIMGNFAGLTKTGTGTLVLTASNTYTGSTQISKGTLALATGTATTIGYIVPVAVTAESWYTPDDRSPIHAIDGSGMSGTNSFSATGNVLVVGKMWMSAQGKVQTWITFDLGAVRTISGFHLWNYNEQTRTVRGVATCGIYSGTSMPANNSSYASNGPAWGSLVQNMTLKPGSDQPSYIGEDYFFSAPVTTRYLQIYVTKNYGDSYYSGISEIGFYTTTATPQAGSLSASSSLNLAAGATLDCSGLGDSAACVLDSNVPFTASGEGTGIGTTAAALRAGVSGTIILGSRPVTFNLPASLTGDDTTHPALYISQGSLSLGKNAFTVNAPTPLDVGTYRLIQVGDGSNGITLDGGSYPPVAGTAVAGKNGAIAISNGNVILKVTDNSYAYWATLHAPGQSPSEDYNHNRIANGIEYFMGASQNVFTPVPAIANGAISWPKSLTFSGSYTVQTSANLKDWTDVPATSLDLSNPAFVRYVVPSGQASLFIRLKVVIAP
jgi:autotransporter-associated beta strand protein